MSNGLLPRIWILLAAALFSTGGAAIKLTSLGPWQVAGWRSGLAAVLLFCLTREARVRWRPGVLLVALSYAATMILFVQANRHTTAASTTFLQSGAPFYILLFGPLFLGERSRHGDLKALVLMGVGMAILLLEPRAPQATAPEPWRGNLLAALSGVTWALTVVGLRWMGRAGEPSMGAVTAGNLLTFVVTAPLAFAGLEPGTVTLVDAGAVLWLGGFQIALAYVCLAAGLKRVPALESSLLMLPELVLSPVWAWALHRELPGGWTLAGGVVLLLATLVRIRAARAAAGEAQS